MAPVLTFVIPVRHQDNAQDWPKLKRNLGHTLKSISQQTSKDWKAIVVANWGADLPLIPSQVEVLWVDFMPNALHEQGDADKETFYEAIRIDKGRRVLSGMLHAGPMKYVMVVDDDDFISNKLVAHALANPDTHGWYIHDGYLWGDGDPAIFQYSGFSKLCGTSHIINAHLYGLPASRDGIDDSYIKKMLGSHLHIAQHLAATGTPLAPLPFRGAVYRVGHAGAHSKSSGVYTEYFRHKWLLYSPGEQLRRLSKLRYRTKRIRKEYFGEETRRSALKAIRG
jgi:hypothetical protein